MDVPDAPNPFRLCINWLNIPVFTLEKSPTNVHTVSDGLNNSRMSNNIQDYTLGLFKISFEVHGIDIPILISFFLVKGRTNAQKLHAVARSYNCLTYSST